MMRELPISEIMDNILYLDAKAAISAKAVEEMKEGLPDPGTSARTPARQGVPGAPSTRQAPTFTMDFRKGKQSGRG